MRTNIEIDDELMAEAMRSTGLSTKKAVVDLALQTLIRLKAQGRIKELRGALHWEGNLDELRESRTPYDDR